MRDEHIIEMLEGTPFRSLGEAELARARAHAEVCPACRRALDAARVSSLLIRRRVEAEVFEPSPFFQTRVLAALRERQAGGGEAWSFARMWNSARALVSTMAAVVALLAGLAVLGPGTQTTTQDAASANDPYSAEAVMLARDDTDEEMTYGQVLTTIYASEDDEVR